MFVLHLRNVPQSTHKILHYAMAKAETLSLYIMQLGKEFVQPFLPIFKTNYARTCFRTPCKNSKVRHKQKLMARKWKTINYSSSWRSFTHICSLVAACHYFCSATQEKSPTAQTLIFPINALRPCISKIKFQKTNGYRMLCYNTSMFLIHFSICWLYKTQHQSDRFCIISSQSVLD